MDDTIFIFNIELVSGFRVAKPSTSIVSLSIGILTGFAFAYIFMGSYSYVADNQNRSVSEGESKGSV